MASLVKRLAGRMGYKLKKKNDAYADHPAASIHNGAIGAGEQLVLYRIRPELWESIRGSYLKGAPAYRAPSDHAAGRGPG